MELFKLRISTPERVFYEGEVYSVTVMQADGIRQVLSGHEPSTGLIVSGRCNFFDKRKITRYFNTGEGFLIVDKDGVKVYSSVVQSDKAAEMAEEDSVQEAEKERQRRQQSREEYVRSKMELAKSLSGNKNKSED